MRRESLVGDYRRSGGGEKRGLTLGTTRLPGARKLPRQSDKPSYDSTHGQDCGMATRFKTGFYLIFQDWMGSWTCPHSCDSRIYFVPAVLFLAFGACSAHHSLVQSSHIDSIHEFGSSVTIPLLAQDFPGKIGNMYPIFLYISWLGLLSGVLA